MNKEKITFHHLKLSISETALESSEFPCPVCDNRRDGYLPKVPEAISFYVRI